MIAEVRLWGSTIGAVSQDVGNTIAQFEYGEEFLESGIELSPVMMPLRAGVYAFPELSRQGFAGLPGLLSDSLPDKFGSAIINAWLARERRTPDSFNAVDRLCYIGTRGLGALEFQPSEGPVFKKESALEVAELVRIASEVLSNRYAISANFGKKKKQDALLDIMRVGTSAGGARAKAVIAWNRDTNEVRSGQVNTGPGFEHWLLKFDGVSNNRDHELADPKGFGAIEYAYSLMAKRAGIEMTECRLLEECGRRHFMTRRFDRPTASTKLHMQSLGALGHYDFNMPGAYSYEMALTMISRLELPRKAQLEQVRRMLFNVVARNQDDHVKNIAFLMGRDGIWRLSPAYDIMYSFNPDGDWTSRHQMTINSKQDEFTIADFVKCASVVRIAPSTVTDILEEVIEAVSGWPDIASEVGIPEIVIREIGSNHRLRFKVR